MDARKYLENQLRIGKELGAPEEEISLLEILIRGLDKEVEKTSEGDVSLSELLECTIDMHELLSKEFNSTSKVVIKLIKRDKNGCAIGIKFLPVRFVVGDWVRKNTFQIYLEEGDLNSIEFKKLS